MLVAGIAISYGYQGDNIKRLTKQLEQKPFETLVELEKEKLRPYSPQAKLSISRPVERIDGNITDEQVFNIKKSLVKRYKAQHFTQISVGSYFGITMIEYYWA